MVWSKGSQLWAAQKHLNQGESGPIWDLPIRFDTRAVQLETHTSIDMLNLSEKFEQAICFSSHRHQRILIFGWLSSCIPESFVGHYRVKHDPGFAHPG
jgi:hypothetical protein